MIPLLEKGSQELLLQQNSRGRANAWTSMAFAKRAVAETNSAQAGTQREFRPRLPLYPKPAHACS